MVRPSLDFSLLLFMACCSVFLSCRNISFYYINPQTAVISNLNYSINYSLFRHDHSLLFSTATLTQKTLRITCSSCNMPLILFCFLVNSVAAHASLLIQNSGLSDSITPLPSCLKKTLSRKNAHHKGHTGYSMQ